MMHSLRQRIKGKLLNGPSTLPKFTSFTSVDVILEHFESEMLPGMTLKNHGEVWQIGHRIPCAWYDMENEEDVCRCWNKGNIACDWAPGMAPEGEPSNQQKSIHLPPAEELVKMRNWFPLGWNGIVPSQQMRNDMFTRVYSRVRAS